MQLATDFVGHRVAASSPQGRFAAGAALLDGTTMTQASAVGKHLLVAFDLDGAGTCTDGSAPTRWLRVHLGLYGAWDFHGRISPVTAECAQCRRARCECG